MTKGARTEPSARVVMTSVTWVRILPSLHSVHSLRWPRSPSPALERPGRMPLTVLAASSSMLYLHSSGTSAQLDHGTCAATHGSTSVS